MRRAGDRSMTRWPRRSRNRLCCNASRGWPKTSNMPCCWTWCVPTSPRCWAAASPEADRPGPGVPGAGLRLADRGRNAQPAQIRYRPGAFAHAHLRLPELGRAGRLHPPRTRRQLGANRSGAAPGEAEIQRVVASIPVKRLRQAGVLELLLALANEADGNGQGGGRGSRPREENSRTWISTTWSTRRS